MVSLWLPVHPASSSTARQHVRDLLTKWGREDLSENAELLVSELTANAIKAMGGTNPLAPEAEGAGWLCCGAELFWVGVYETSHPDKLIVLEVWDSVRTPPKLSHAALDEPGGQGLRLVNLLAAEWGYRWLSGSWGGKVVWAALDVLADAGEMR